MPENSKDNSRPFDVHTIHHLIRLMKRYELTAIDLIDGSTQIRLRRRGETAAVAAGASGPVPPALAPAPAPTAAPPLAAPEPALPEPKSSTSVFIRSPMVGTFYAASAPDAPPFVSVGSVVRPETVVCVIEAMKVFTDITAGVVGTIVEVLVKNGQPVEFDQPLFRVEPA
jgi:acetyl-CoA carboxylase biotin carboxyl carrier protein